MAARSGGAGKASSADSAENGVDGGSASSGRSVRAALDIVILDGLVPGIDDLILGVGLKH
jgi:hypothetical protein